MKLKEILFEMKLHLKEKEVLKNILVTNKETETKIILTLDKKNKFEILLIDTSNNTVMMNKVFDDLFDDKLNEIIFNKLNNEYMYYLDIIEDIKNGDI